MKISLILALLLAGCGPTNQLAYVSRDAPMWHMNPTLENTTVNALTKP